MPSETLDPNGFPVASFGYGEDAFVQPKSAAEAERVLEAAYKRYDAGTMTYEDYSTQKAICWKAAHNDHDPPAREWENMPPPGPPARAVGPPDMEGNYRRALEQDEML